MIRKLIVSVALVATGAAANASPILSEGFDDVSALTGNGWILQNNSAPVGETGWFQGNTGVFEAQSGGADSYIAANYLNAGLGGNVDNWLITPLLHSSSFGLALDFETRSEGLVPGDNLEVLYNNTSPNAPNNLADWVSLGSIGAYPADWSFFEFLYTAGEADLRFAFRYTVTDTSVNGDYIGIDTFKVTGVPEPGTWTLMAMGLLLTPLVLRRRRARI